MKEYLHSHVHQEKSNGRFKTITVDFKNIIATDKNIALTTDKEALRFFRRRGSKHYVVRRWKDGKRIIRIYSYINANYRTVHIYREI